MKGIDGVAGKAADLTSNDQVKFPALGIGKHFHKGRALFGRGSGDALVDVAVNDLPVGMIPKLVIVPLHLVAKRIDLRFMLGGNATVKGNAAVAVLVQWELPKVHSLRDVHIAIPPLPVV